MSVIGSVKSVFVPVHREANKFIAIALVAGVGLGFFWIGFLWLGVFAAGGVAYFFRDPERVTPTGRDLIISPADGKISYIGPATPPVELELEEGNWVRVSVFMNVLNVHVNRSPIPGTITKIAYRPGLFVNADLDKASEDNERNGLVIENENIRIGVVQIAGLVARRIVSFAKEGDKVSAGERFGLIRFGSRLDVYVPESSHVSVAIGQTAVAGETILARFNEEKSDQNPSAREN